MADKSFDVVIVGGGNKALVLAMYLTKFGGLSVGIFEERHELGGGWSGEEQTPGYVGNICSSNHSASYHKPVYRDFPEFIDYGGKYGYTGIVNSIILEEDHSALTLYNAFDDVDPSQEKTAKEIARFSEKDAETYLYFWDKARKIWEPAWDEWQFNPAQPLEVPDAMDRLFRNREAGFDPAWMLMSPLQLVKDVFESIELQVLLLRLGGEVSFGVETPGSALVVLLLNMIVVPYLYYVHGGTHQLAHAAHRIILENGGKSFTRHRVTKVIIENGQAKGVRLDDGTEIGAKYAVVTSVDPQQLCFELIGAEYLDARLLRRVKNLETHCMGGTGYLWALKEKPKYKAEMFNPDVHRARGVIPEKRDLGHLVREGAARRCRQWMPQLQLNDELDFMVLSYEDYIASHSGCIAETVALCAPMADYMTDEEWKIWEKKHAEDVLKKWERFAPNMTWDNVIDYNAVHPRYMADMCRNYVSGNPLIVDPVPCQSGRFRPLLELAGHRTPINGLYATGSGWHPYPSAHSCQGYNCYKVMADDFGLRKPWEENGYPW